MSGTILIGDCREQLATLPERSVHCCVTSPPYWGLRDYGVAGQIGLEQTPEEYVAGMVDVFREVWRVLRECRLPDGSPLQVDPDADVWGHDCPCGYSPGGACPWGREFNEETEECCCPDGWVVWRVAIGCDGRGHEIWGPIALDPADAILLAARAVEATAE